MSARSEPGPTMIEGQSVQLDEQHAVAIYRRGGSCWVAEFRGGAATLVDACSWFRFHAGGLRYSHGRRAAALRSATPLTPEVIEEIERLHRQADLKEARIATGAVAALGTVQRYWTEMTAALRGVGPGERSASADVPERARAGACSVRRLTREVGKESAMRKSVRAVPVFVICLAAVFSWIGVLAVQLGPYIPEDSGTKVATPADNTTD